MNESHYPPSPAYYRRHPNIDARDLVSPDYWTDSALVHLMRAGRKDGEPFADAITNAFTCLALWFRSQSLPVPHYSDALDAAHKRIAELEAAALEAAALTAVESRPVAPALDAPPVEWTDAELAEWLTANMGEPDHDGPRLKQWQWSGDRWYVDAAWSSTGWHGLVFSRVDTAMPGFTATEAARILNATKPDPFAALLEVRTDEQLESWVAANLELCGDTISRTGTARNANTWAIGAGRYTASHAARTLHRILGAAP